LQSLQKYSSIPEDYNIELATDFSFRDISRTLPGYVLHVLFWPCDGQGNLADGTYMLPVNPVASEAICTLCSCENYIDNKRDLINSVAIGNHINNGARLKELEDKYNMSFSWPDRFHVSGSAFFFIEEDSGLSLNQLYFNLCPTELSHPCFGGLHEGLKTAQWGYVDSFDGTPPKEENRPWPWHVKPNARQFTRPEPPLPPNVQTSVFYQGAHNH